MKKKLKVVATLSLIMALCGVFSMGQTTVSKPKYPNEIARNWDPGESKPLVIL